MMRFGEKWSECLLNLVHRLNNFDMADAFANRDFVDFYIANQRVGMIAPKTLTELSNYPDIFKTVQVNGKRRVELSDTLSTVEDRTAAFHKVLTELRDKQMFRSLKGWRNETYPIRRIKSDPPLCHVERSGCALFGFNQYGTHINGYTFRDGELIMWIGRRSPTKPTFPNMLDNMCAGGLASGLGVRECAIKESHEEASVDPQYLNKLKSVGSVSYLYEDERGVFPETQYVFDLELPPTFQPNNADGEMDNFYSYTLAEIQDLIMNGEFKPNCALVVLDFMIRHGYVTPENEPNYLYLVECMHRSLQPPR